MAGLAGIRYLREADASTDRRGWTRNVACPITPGRLPTCASGPARVPACGLSWPLVPGVLVPGGGASAPFGLCGGAAEAGPASSTGRAACRAFCAGRPPIGSFCSSKPDASIHEAPPASPLVVVCGAGLVVLGRGGADRHGARGLVERAASAHTFVAMGVGAARTRKKLPSAHTLEARRFYPRSADGVWRGGPWGPPGGTIRGPAPSWRHVRPRVSTHPVVGLPPFVEARGAGPIVLERRGADHRAARGIRRAGRSRPNVRRDGGGSGAHPETLPPIEALNARRFYPRSDLGVCVSVPRGPPDGDLQAPRPWRRHERPRFHLARTSACIPATAAPIDANEAP